MDTPSRQDLEKNSRPPVDPAFRPAAPPNNLPTAGNYPDLNTNPGVLAPPSPSTAPAPGFPTNPPAGNAVGGASPNMPTPPLPGAGNAGAGGGTNPPVGLNQFPELEDPMEGDSEIKRVITIGGIIVGVLLITAGLLFIYSKNKTQDKATDENETSTEETPENPGEETTEPAEEESPNEVVLKIPDNTQIHKHILVHADQNPLNLARDYFSDVEEGKEIVELTFYDEGNAQLSLSQWFEASKLYLPEYVNKIVTSNYHILLVPDSEAQNPKIALIVESNFSDYKKTEEVLKKWEKYMVKDLKPLILFGDDFDFVAGFEEDPAFESSGSYPGGRYFNFLKNGSLSLNYIVMRDTILITNSFNSFEKGVNYIKNTPDL